MKIIGLEAILENSLENKSINIVFFYVNFPIIHLKNLQHVVVLVGKVLLKLLD